MHYKISVSIQIKGQIRKTNTIFFIRHKILDLRSDSAPGPSGITTQFLKHFIEPASIALLREIESKLNRIGKWWKRGFIKLLPKSGDLTKIENWRPISLLNVEFKLFTSEVNDYLYPLLKDNMGSNQIGFKKGYWIQQNHLLLQAILKSNSDELDGGIIFIDFKKAYDSIYHEWIAYRLTLLLGVRWCEFIMDTIVGGTSKVLFKGRLSKKIYINRGVRQGDCLSPLLFNIAVAPLFDDIQTGCYVGKTSINYLAFADDGGVPVKNSDDVNIFINWSKKVESLSGLELSASKTEFLPFLNSDLRTPWKTVSSSKYLGAFFNQLGDILWDSVLNKQSTQKTRTNQNYNVIQQC